MSKIAVITGAGVGRATAETFTRQVYDVALLSRDPERLEAAAGPLGLHRLAKRPDSDASFPEWPVP